MEKKIVIKQADTEKRIYAAQYYYMELSTAKMLNDLNVHYEIADVAIEKRLRAIEKNAELELDDMQRQAVTAFIFSPLQSFPHRVWAAFALRRR